MSLLDRLVPASALRWGRLTAEPCICFNAPFHFHDCERRHRIVQFDSSLWRTVPPARPDPAAAWGEADRRAEDR